MTHVDFYNHLHTKIMDLLQENREGNEDKGATALIALLSSICVFASEDDWMKNLVVEISQVLATQHISECQNILTGLVIALDEFKDMPAQPFNPGMD